MTYLTELQEAVQQPSEPTAGFTPLTDQILALTAHLPPISLIDLGASMSCYPSFRALSSSAQRHERWRRHSLN